MAQVIHRINGKTYLYDHQRVGNKVVTTYLYPVDSEGQQLKGRRTYIKQRDKMQPESIKEPVKESIKEPVKEQAKTTAKDQQKEFKAWKEEKEKDKIKQQEITKQKKKESKSIPANITMDGYRVTYQDSESSNAFLTRDFETSKEAQKFDAKLRKEGKEVYSVGRTDKTPYREPMRTYNFRGADGKVKTEYSIKGKVIDEDEYYQRKRKELIDYETKQDLESGSYSYRGREIRD